MTAIKVILLTLTMVFLFITPNDSFASMHRQQIITNQIPNDIFKINFSYIVAHKEEKPHPHPHNIMMGKKIKKEKKRDESGMKINIRGAKSLASEAKKRDHKNQKIDSVLDTPELQNGENIK